MPTRSHSPGETIVPGRGDLDAAFGDDVSTAEDGDFLDASRQDS